MKMGYTFTRVATIINYESVPTVQHAQLFCDPTSREQHPAEERRIFRSRQRDPRNAAFGDDQHMHRGLRLDVMKSKEILLLVNDRGMDFARGDSFEDGHGLGDIQEKFAAHTGARCCMNCARVLAGEIDDLLHQGSAFPAP